MRPQNFSPIFKYSVIGFAILMSTIIAIHMVVPEMIDKRMNKVTLLPPYTVSPEATKLYDSLDFVSDLHSDVLLWKRDINHQHQHGHQDIPRMIEANVALQGFTIVNKVPRGLNFDSNPSDSDQLTLPFAIQGRPFSSWYNLTERVLTQINELEQYAIDSGGRLKVIKTKRDLSTYLIDRTENNNMTAAFIGIEGAQALHGDIKTLNDLSSAGVTMIGLTHFFDNEVGGSAHGIVKGGITEFGRLLISEMEKRNILVDLSHASPQLINDVLSIANKPLIVSHTGVKGTCDNIRNLSDDQLKGIASTGGVIGIAMFEAATCGTDAKTIASAIKYTSDLVGAQHVGLGSDFDGAVTTAFDVTGLPKIIDELLKLGISEQDIRLIMGDNIKRVLLKNLPD
jgi:microsomal dipeptidase-like Zn-dependent dipeptidase